MHMQLLPLLLVQGALHSNPLPLQSVYAKNLTGITVQTYTHRYTHSINAK